MAYPAPLTTAGPQLRTAWLTLLQQLAYPVLGAAADGKLKATMPVETCGTATKDDRAKYTHLEALGRLLCGIAPWLESHAGGDDEQRLRRQLRELARKAVANAVDPASPDCLNFNQGAQPVVDAAFLAEAMLRAPRELVQLLDAPTQTRLADALASSRVIKPGFNNWLLFSATVECGLHLLGRPADRMRIDYAVRQHEQWYRGDGVYGDGPEVHVDYYNSFVIHPMLVDVLAFAPEQGGEWGPFREKVEKRATRHAAVLERSISPEGAIPVVGRSLAYRCGTMHALAQAALRNKLPADVSAAQVRGALSAVIFRTLGAARTFDDAGFLRVGFAGHQPSIGEGYISTGSLYLCSTALLPLGLPPDDPFWRDPPAAWTSVKAYAGDDLPADHALHG
jgi:hypothetical protein